MNGRHAVVLIAYNNLELTKKCLASVAAQDVGPLEIFVVNNGSTDGTREWLEDFKTFVTDSHLVRLTHLDYNQSPVALSNQMLGQIFGLGHQHVLGVANDIWLPPNFYRLALEYPRGLVTASMTPDDPQVISEAHATSECTPMAVVLLRRWAWQALIDKDGYWMDERYWLYASDCDLALRLAACGIRGVQLDLQYGHYGSATWRLAEPIEQKGMLRQADVDREYFRSKWKFGVSDEEYGKLASDINFRGEPR